MADLQTPGATTPLAEAGTTVAARPWFTFWSLVGKRMTALGGIQQVTTADAVDPATTMALVNELKAKFNELVNSQEQ